MKEEYEKVSDDTKTSVQNMVMNTIAPKVLTDHKIDPLFSYRFAFWLGFETGVTEKQKGATSVDCGQQRTSRDSRPAPTVSPSDNKQSESAENE
jgi:hypothetical protein